MMQRAFSWQSLALCSEAGYSPADMPRSRSSLRRKLRHVMRTVTAIVTLAQLVVVTAAPLGERADSGIAAVHMEQAGTSRHHGHGDFCAVCAASSLTALPPRAARVLSDALMTSHPMGSDVLPPADRATRYSFARAPPV
jgi:hypothetical protein